MKRLRSTVTTLGQPRFFVVILFLAAAATSYGLGQNSPKVSTASAAGIHEVVINDDQMKPNAMLVKTGESVQFNPKDGKKHNIASGKGSKGPNTGPGHNHQEGSESGYFEPDEGYRVTFNKEGVYYYHDHDKPGATTSVIVSNDPTK